MRISDWSSDVCSSDLRLTHSFSNRSRVSTFREFRTAEKAAELAPAFNHVAHAPVSLARLDRRGAIKQCRLPRRLASYPLPLAVSGLFKFPGMDVVIPCPDASPVSLSVRERKGIALIGPIPIQNPSPSVDDHFEFNVSEGGASGRI